MVEISVSAFQGAPVMAIPTWIHTQPFRKGRSRKPLIGVLLGDGVVGEGKDVLE